MTENSAKKTISPSVVEKKFTPAHWRTRNGRETQLSEDILRPVVVHQVDEPAGYYAPLHSHDRGQLLFISEGLIQVSAKGVGHWIAPPQRAVWIPPLIEHDARNIYPTKMSNVYICKTLASDLPDQCQVVSVTSLLRELILSMTEFECLYDESGAEGRLVAVFLDQLKTTPVAPLHLPYPKDVVLQKVADTLMKNPADKRSIEQWSDPLAMSSRTFARHFKSDTGLTFGQWRQQLRLLEALKRVAKGDPIAHIAQDLGYDSQSAFIAMFRKALGKTPSRYFD
ncbi:MAG: helix-turn-helix transcriptional regulator [Pseudomonadales bacterium]|nr:helix-turn-helix transcriptional regulator [Pseudomonadales bacterium]